MVSGPFPGGAGGRRLVHHPAPPGKNSMQGWVRLKGPLRPTLNLIVLYLCRFLPWLELKNRLYRLLGMRVGRGVSVGLGAMFDIFYPELISIGDNTVVGYNCTILAHEFLVEGWRTGPVEIGRNVLLGSGCVVLPGVSVGDGAQVSALSLVNRDVPPGVLAGGVPVRVIAARGGDGAAESGGGSPAGPPGTAP
ncbi:MAG: acyltransferase [Acetobacteraceae bacterium]|nr:acyltransferase [Acetobacteraceae bacterium]